MDGDLSSRLSALEQRVERLEGGRRPVPALPAAGEDGVSGSVVFSGKGTMPGAGSVTWQEELPVAGVLASGWADAAGALTALGHPVRLELIRRMLAGARTTHELAEIADLGTSGQLYHHLRELQAAGLVVQRRRNDYAVPAERVIPCLILVAAAKSCARATELAS